MKKEIYEANTNIVNAIEIENIGGCCPCQASGKIYGHPFYFRARHGEWTLDVVANGCNPVLSESPLFHFEGEDPDNGFMPEYDAMRIIGICFLKIRNQLYLATSN